MGAGDRNDHNSFLQMVLALGMHQLNFRRFNYSYFSQFFWLKCCRIFVAYCYWPFVSFISSNVLIDLIDSLCDGHLDCNDFLTAITGFFFSLSLFPHLYIHPTLSQPPPTPFSFLTFLLGFCSYVYIFLTVNWKTGTKGRKKCLWKQSCNMLFSK